MFQVMKTFIPALAFLATVGGMKLAAQPVITTEPAGQTVLPGGTAMFGAEAQGCGPFTYQWQFNGADLSNGIVSTVAGTNSTGSSEGYAGDGGPAVGASLAFPAGVALDRYGNLYIADLNANRIRKVSSANGVITTVAGNGVGTYSGDGGQATNASFSSPASVTLDAAGNLFIADWFNHRIRRVSADGIITTVAGNGFGGYAGDNGTATNASLSYPYGVAVDAAGDIFIADYGNQRVRKVDANGIITTVAGNGDANYSGDDGAATNASLNYPTSVAVDPSGNLFIADYGNDRIREVGTNGIITTIAGDGVPGFSGDGGPATNASIESAWGVTLDASGNLFIVEQAFADRVRKVDTNGIITTVAGNGSEGYFGDGGAATNAGFFWPRVMALDASGNLFIADSYNYRIREVSSTVSSSLILRNAGPGDAGEYRVVVTGPCGSVTSNPAMLDLGVPIPTIQTTSKTNDVFAFRWTATPGLTYQVEYTSDVNSSNWMNLGDPITATDLMMGASDVIGSNMRRFYRVQLLLPP
jgi:NHL repeat